MRERGVMSLLALTATVLGARASALELDVSPARPSFQSREPIVIRVLVRNPHDSKDAPYLKRGFWPVPCTYPMDGDLGLNVTITDPGGRTLTATPSYRVMLVRMQTVPQHFERLPPGAMFGEEIVLTGKEYGFELTERGRYAVAVSVAGAGALEWYDAWLAEVRDDKTLRGPALAEAQPEFQRNELFSGSLRGTTTFDLE